MIWAEKLRERTLGSAFKAEEVAELLGVTQEESFKIMRDLVRNCWVVTATNGKFKCVHGKKRDEYISKSIELCGIEIKEKYELFTHLKSLKDDKEKN